MSEQRTPPGSFGPIVSSAHLIDERKAQLLRAFTSTSTS